MTMNDDLASLIQNNQVDEKTQDNVPEVTKSEQERVKKALADSARKPTPITVTENQDDDEASQEVENRGETDQYGLDALRDLKPRTSKTKPEVTVGYYTKEAAELLINRKIEKNDGRKPIHVTGLEGFDFKLFTILDNAKADNPFADSLLREIEDQSNELLENIHAQTDGIEQRMATKFRSNQASLNIKKSDFLTTISPRFRNQLTMHLLWITKSIDNLHRVVNIAKSQAVINEREARTYQTGAIRKFRHIVTLASRYRNLPVTRKDLALQTAQGVRVLTEFATEKSSLILRPDVLLMSNRSSFAPPIAGRKHSSMEEIRPHLETLAQHLTGAKPEETNNKKTA
ncbi:DUF1845 family protein [Vibrio parahaemolyticus]